MADKIGERARKPNPAMEEWEVLVGTWKTVGSHPLIPGVTLHGTAVFEWLENGAFLRMRSEIEEAVGVPHTVAIFGSDDALGRYFMLSFDERGVSRRYDCSLQGMTWKWWRDAPGFAQRMTFTISEDRQTMVGEGELSRDGAAWEKDLDLTYTRVI